MSDNYNNNNQITRKDAKNCFVESLNDSFSIGKIHFAFATYDVSKPVGQRQTNNIHIYIDVDEFLELCRKVEFGEFKYIMNQKKQAKDNTPIYETLGGTSAETLAKRNKSRADGKSLSRTAKLIIGEKKDLLFVADSGPGEADAKGLIVPKFGGRPENHVQIPMTFSSFSELMLITKVHYQAWLSAKYASTIGKDTFSGGGFAQ